MKQIYLDYAAATPLAPQVLSTMDEVKGQFYNPSAVYLAAQEAAGIIDKARASVAKHLGAKPAEIIFTSGATESDNLAIGGILRAHPGSSMALTATEHKAVSQPAAGFGVNVDVISVDKNGLITPQALKQSIKPSTVLLSIAYADSELGAVQSFRRLLPVIEAERSRRRDAKQNLPLYLHSDASQAANFLDLHVSRLGVDLLSLGGGKIYGPKNCGVLYVNHKVDLAPIMFGGGQERGLRSGTEPVSTIVGFARALDLVQSERKQQSQRLSAMKNQLKRELSSIDNLQFNGDDSHQLPNMINFSLTGADGERLVMKLDQLGLMVGTGAACTIRQDQPSTVLKAIGLSDKQANGSLRISLGRPTTEVEVTRAARLLRQVLGG